VASYPALSGKDIIRILESFGFEVVRISKGSHYQMWKPGHPTVVPVPVHGSVVVPQGTLHSILRLAGLSAGRFFTRYQQL
jgi:predicted RNA binding protein YcfA (HicA-like mRNA interferase family)